MLAELYFLISFNLTHNVPYFMIFQGSPKSLIQDLATRMQFLSFRHVDAQVRNERSLILFTVSVKISTHIVAR